MSLHSELAGGRWRSLELCEQLAHVGSEVERTLRARENGQEARFERALERALELFDLTSADGRWRGARLREIRRAREEFLRLFYDPACDWSQAAGLRRYFLAFATMSRNRPLPGS
jgi:hypothetical protein